MAYDTIIIGAGLGGLSAGAYLARAGRKVLVLEKTGELGGRCRSVELMGHRFDIGADCFGSRVLTRLKELGKGREAAPVRYRTLADSEGSRMTIPSGLHSLRELRGMGMGAGEMARFGKRLARQLYVRPYRKYSNSQELVNFITENRHLREILNIGAFLTGNEPENMPAYSFNLRFGRAYGHDRPFYPAGGSGRIPELFAEVIKENGGAIVFNASPRRILVDAGRVRGVLLDGREVEAKNVVSGIGILPTVHQLVGKENFEFPYGYMNTLGYYKEGLAMASVFTVFKRSVGINKGVQTYARCSKNIAAMFRVLKEGSFPERSMAVLSCPDAVVDSGGEHLAGTVRFLVPKGVSARVEIEAEADKVLMDMDSLVPGFYEGIVSKAVYTPRKYVESFGFISTTSPVADSVHYEKTGVDTPLPGLYCVGATVLPHGGCAASAIESGRAAARMLIKKGE